MSKDMLDEARVQEIKDRLADRYTATEIADILDLPVEDLIEEFWDRISRSKVLMVEVAASGEDEDADIS